MRVATMRPWRLRRRRLIGEPLARMRVGLARRPWLFWLIVTTTAAVAAGAARSAVASVEQEREAWGMSVSVLVTTRPVETGERLAGATAPVEVPLAMTPINTVVDVEPGAVAMHPIGQGEILAEGDVSGSGGARALAPPGWRLVAVVEPVPSRAGVGQHASVAADGVVLARDSVVIGRHGEATLVAVPDGDAAAVAAAAVESRAMLLVES